MENLKKAIDEIFRVCRKGGFILISDFNEEGRKVYDHELDNGKFLNTLEESLARHTSRSRKVKTEYNMMFICRK
jgi:ubiquinone/menaquinone biosynthesis C-methylase UbiE